LAARTKISLRCTGGDLEQVPVNTENTVGATLNHLTSTAKQAFPAWLKFREACRDLYNSFFLIDIRDVVQEWLQHLAKKPF